MPLPILGIDIAKAKADAVLLIDDKVKTKTFPQSQKGFLNLLEWLQKHHVTTLHACMEATGNFSFPLATFLFDHGFQVSVVNPSRIKSYADSQLSRNKTDLNDAKIIADFCKSQNPPLWNPPTQENRELQALTRHLDSLVSMRQMEANRLASGLDCATVIQSIKDHLEHLDQQIKDLKKNIKNHIDQNPNLKNQKDLLVTIPGIADLTASKILSEIPQIKNFDSVRKIVAYAGLNPSQHISGSSIHRKTRLSKKGNSRIRTSLYMPAIVAMRKNPILKIFADRLSNKGKSKMQIIGAIMRKLLHISYGVLKNNQPFNPNLISVA